MVVWVWLPHKMLALCIGCWTCSFPCWLFNMLIGVTMAYFVMVVQVEFYSIKICLIRGVTPYKTDA